MLAMKKLITLGTTALLAWSASSYADRLFDIDTYLVE